MGRVRGKTRSSSGDSGGQNIGPPPSGKIGSEKHGMQKFRKLFSGIRASMHLTAVARIWKLWHGVG